MGFWGFGGEDVSLSVLQLLPALLDSGGRLGLGTSQGRNMHCGFLQSLDPRLWLSTSSTFVKSLFFWIALLLL